MSVKSLYTIGHGTRTITDFILLLKQYQIEYLIDVRSQPYSKFNAAFNQADLKYRLESENIRYVFFGDTLGGRPKDPNCYDIEGKVDYKLVESKDFYKEGIVRLRTAYAKSIPIALMCSESNPCQCHRSKLIGMTLFNSSDKICLYHIDEKGRLKDQPTVMNELNKGKNVNDLWNDSSQTTSRKSYL
ncbi:MAG: hypothetical protein JWN78_1964 [Bacteroidota bacterium]|nr:hypothetical protein [Bacteroidota bacterium]